jgi:hypothetical protein
MKEEYTKFNKTTPGGKIKVTEIYIRRVWKYQRGNQNPYIEEEQTTQWPKEKVQKDKQRSQALDSGKKYIPRY